MSETAVVAPENLTPPPVNPGEEDGVTLSSVSTTETSETDDKYDWNVLARLIDVLHSERQTAEDSNVSITWYQTDLPVDNEELPEERVSQYKLNHGDILRFNDERFSQAFIVSREEDGKYKLIENPDESGAGYLTIPKSLLVNVTNGVEKYINVTENNCLNLHLSRHDDFVVDKLGKEVPESWEFDVEYVDGCLDAVHITQGKEVWECLEWKDVQLKTIKEFFQGTAEPPAKLLVKLDLKGEKFEEYKNKFGQGKKFGWVKEFAKLPTTWAVEKGASGMGAKHYKTEWECKGPLTTKDDVIETIKKFFEDFEVSIEEK